MSRQPQYPPAFTTAFASAVHATVALAKDKAATVHALAVNDPSLRPNVTLEKSGLRREFQAVSAAPWRRVRPRNDVRTGAAMNPGNLPGRQDALSATDSTYGIHNA